VVDATISPTTREESHALGSDAPHVPVQRFIPATRRVLAIVWGGLMLGLIAFIAFATVRVGAGNWIGSRRPVREIWSGFTAYLVEEGASPILVTGVTAAAVLTVLGAGVVLWLAFALEDAPVESSPDDTTEQ